MKKTNNRISRLEAKGEGVRSCFLRLRKKARHDFSFCDPDPMFEFELLLFLSGMRQIIVLPKKPD
jgi:hypothetical protein